MNDSAKQVNVGEILDNSKSGNKIFILVLVLMIGIMFMDGYDYGVINNASPLIMDEFGANTAVFGPVFSAATFGWMFGAIVFGMISDKFGRKLALVFGSVLFTVFAFLTYLSWDVPSLIAIRFLAGFGMGSAVPISMVYVTEFASSKMRAASVTIEFSGFVIGSVLGAYISAGLIPAFGWRSVFLLGSIMPIPMILILIFFLPESVRWLALHAKTNKQQMQLAKAMNRIDKSLECDENTEFVMYAAKKAEKQPMSKLFEGSLKWATPLLWIWYIVSSIGLNFIGNWMPEILVEKGLDIAQTSVLIGNAGWFGMAGTLLIGFYLDKFGFRWGAVWSALTIVFTALIGGAGSVPIMFVFIAISGFFMSGEHSILTAIVPNFYPFSVRAQGSGWANAIAKVGGIIAPIIGGLFLATGMPLGIVFLIAASPFVVDTVLCWFLGKHYDKKLRPLYEGKKSEIQSEDQQATE